MLVSCFLHILEYTLFFFQKKTPSISYKNFQMRLLFTKKTPTKEGAETASNPPSSPPQLYSLELDFIDDKLS